MTQQSMEHISFQPIILFNAMYSGFAEFCLSFTLKSLIQALIRRSAALIDKIIHLITIFSLCDTKNV